MLVVVNDRKKDLILTNIIYIPGIPLNLISIGQLSRINCPINFITKGLIYRIEFGLRGITT